jgi:hypothetical protein
VQGSNLGCNCAAVFAGLAVELLLLLEVCVNAW